MAARTAWRVEEEDALPEAMHAPGLDKNLALRFGETDCCVTPPEVRWSHMWW